MLILAVISAFEFAVVSGPQAGMTAGAATGDWRSGLSANPAALAGTAGLRAAAAYANPFGLPGLAWGDAAAAWGGRVAAFGAAVSRLGVTGYEELDARVAAAARPAAGISIGINLHALVRNANRYGSDVVPAVDAGAAWRGRRFSLGAAVERLNNPRFRAGDGLAPRLLVSGCWQPVDEFRAAVDASREGETEALAVGAEFRLVPRVALRLGLGTVPLEYSAGLGVRVGPIDLDYAYRFNPQLGATDVLGIGGSWR